MVGFDEVHWYLKHGTDQRRIEECFLGPNRLLRALPRVNGWVGANLTLPDGTELKRGRAYALRLIDGDSLACRAPLGHKAFAQWLGSYVAELASLLGTVVERGLSGDAPPETFTEIQERARAKGIAAGCNGFTPITSAEGREFYHLAALPHLVLDESGFRDAAVDAVEIRMRVFGNVVPAGTRVPE